MRRGSTSLPETSNGSQGEDPAGTFGGIFRFMRVLHHAFFLFSAALLIGCGRPSEPSSSTDVAPDSTDRALADLERRIVADPANAALYAERAGLHRSQGRVKEAMADLKRALAVDSTNATYRLHLGDLYYSALMIREAHAEFSAALRLDPSSNEARLKTADLEMVAFRQYGRAMELANEVLRSDPHNAQAYFIKGWIYMENKDTTLAISSFRTCVEQDPSHFQAWMELAELHASRGNRLALDYFNTAIDLKPQAVEPLYGKGMFCQEHGMDSLAMDAYERIKRIDPKNALPWYNQGYILLEHRRDARGAIGHFTAAGKLLPSYQQAFFNRGLAYERLGVLDSAAMDYQTALRIDPGYDAAANALGRLQARGLRILPVNR